MASPGLDDSAHGNARNALSKDPEAPITETTGESFDSLTQAHVGKGGGSRGAEEGNADPNVGAGYIVGIFWTGAQ